MEDIFTFFSDLSYLGVFLLLFLVNVPPILMPPTWLVLSSFYLLDDSMSPFLLALVGATGATAGRFVLLRFSMLFQRYMNQERRSSLDKVADYLRTKKLGYLLVTFLFSISPLPSNVLFVGYGLMRAKSLQIYLGFWVGRVIAYFVMISISKVVLTPFTQLFEDRLLGVLVIDALAVASLVFFTSVKWDVLIKEKKLRFVKPRLWRI